MSLTQKPTPGSAKEPARNEPAQEPATGSPPRPTRRIRPAASDALHANRGQRPASDYMAPFVDALVGTPSPVRFEFWDGTSIGDSSGPGSLVFHSPDALRRMLWSPNELGLARAYVVGDLDIIGDVPGVLRMLLRADGQEIDVGARSIPKLLAAARHAGALGRPLAAPPEELVPRGALHSRRRDAQVVRHHYDVGNEFYRLLLGPSLTYSCARFTDARFTLEQAQAAKHDLVCRKLGLHTRPGMRLLDVGCGWGSMALHAATNYGASVVGVTLSEEQAHAARGRVTDAGLGDRIDICVQDYRDINGEKFDAISSVGMFEHVGRKESDGYFRVLRGLLTDGGRLLNHAISSAVVSRLHPKSFMYRYVFPDGELSNVGDTVLSMERAGFEVRDVESLREHYSRTLHGWLANLDERFDEATRLVGEHRSRIWRLYISGSILGFDDGGLSVHQVLGVVPDAHGNSAMPPGRAEWEQGNSS